MVDTDVLLKSPFNKEFVPLAAESADSSQFSAVYIQGLLQLQRASLTKGMTFL